MSLVDVYCHTSPSGKRYVGYSARGMTYRWRRHVVEARSGSAHPIHCAIRKYGADAFRHELLEQCDTVEGAQRAERRWIAQRGTMAPAGYNATAGGEGMRASAEVREKLAAAQRGKTASAETRAKQSAAHKGRTFSDEHRAKIAAAASNASEETRAKLRAASLGRKHSPETRAKLSEIARSRSADHRAKQASAVRGRPLSEEHRARIANGLRAFNAARKGGA